MSKVTDSAQETEKGVFNTHVRDTGKEQIVGAGAVTKDGEPSTAATIADGGPEPPADDPDYVPGKEEGVEEVEPEKEIAV